MDTMLLALPLPQKNMYLFYYLVHLHPAFLSILLDREFKAFPTSKEKFKNHCFNAFLIY